MQIDYLLVGQGLAGSVLADHLMKAGFSIKIISDPTLSNSSLVAGGLYNPVTGRKLVKTWNCDALFDYLIPYYKSLEDQLGSSFLFEKPIYRPFFSVEAQNEWMGKSADGSFDKYVEQVYIEPAFAEVLHDEFGGVLLKNCGYVDTAELLAAFKGYFRKHGVLEESVFNHAELSVNIGHVTYNKESYNGVIFCEGQKATENPYFNWLPFKPVKGELIYIESEHETDKIYNRGVFVIQKKDGVCKVGATYDHEDLEKIPTLKAKNELSNKLQGLVKYNFTIVDQVGGIRPATKDRRPFIGAHPKLKNVFIFNGMGAKGVSLAPFYANQLVKWHSQNAKLEDEVNIERYFSLF